MTRQIVVQMHGEPGSGKSTVAQALGARLDAVVIDKDVIKAALLRTGIEESLAGPASYEAFHALASAVLKQGFSVILDNPIYWEKAQERSRARATESGALYVFIACECPDRDELIQRLKTRPALQSQPREPLDLKQFPGSIECRYEPRLTVDTTLPLDEVVEKAVAYIQRALTTDDHAQSAYVS